MKSKTLYNDCDQRESSGDDSRIITAVIDNEGVLNFSASDSGDSVEEYFRKDEYEFGVLISAENKEMLLQTMLKAGRSAVPPKSSEADPDRLLLALLEDRFGGEMSAVDRFRNFCEAQKIPYEWWMY